MKALSRLFGLHHYSSPFFSHISVLRSPISIVIQTRFSGHNKWSKIRHTKGANDRKKGLLFSKISLSILSAIKDKGPDVASNTRLAALISQAKAVGMPKDSMEAAIKRATGQSKGGTVEDAIYEAIGPNGVAMIIQAVTDNNTRSIAGIKGVLGKNGGSMGSVQWMFERKGKISITRGQSDHLPDEMMENAINIGAEDIESMEDGSVEIICNYVDVDKISKELTTNYQYEVTSAELTYIPTTTVEVAEAEAERRLSKCIEELEQLDDVVKVHCNAI